MQPYKQKKLNSVKWDGEFLMRHICFAMTFYDIITIVASPYQIMIPSMAYERDIDTQ